MYIFIQKYIIRTLIRRLKPLVVDDDGAMLASSLELCSTTAVNAGVYEPPEFDLYLGPNYWTTLTNESRRTEIIYSTPADTIVNNIANIDVCLVNINKGIPYISTLELRPLIVPLTRWGIDHHSMWIATTTLVALLVRQS